MRIFSNFGGLALMLCLPFDNVHREFTRLANKKTCYGEENKLTGNSQKWKSLQ